MNTFKTDKTDKTHEEKLNDALQYLKARNKYILTSSFKPRPAGVKFSITKEYKELLGGGVGEGVK